MTDFANERSVPYRFVQHEYSQPDIREYLHSVKLVASDVMTCFVKNYEIETIKCARLKTVYSCA